MVITTEQLIAALQKVENKMLPVVIQTEDEVSHPLVSVCTFDSSLSEGKDIKTENLDFDIAEYDEVVTLSSLE